MPSYYFKTFRRSLFRNKASFLLNLLALVLGLGCFLFTLLFVFYEHGYDRSNSKLDRIGRLVSDVHSGGNESKEAIDPRPADLGIALAAMGILMGVIVLRYAWQSARVNPGRVLREL